MVDYLDLSWIIIAQNNLDDIGNWVYCRFRLFIHNVIKFNRFFELQEELRNLRVFPGFLGLKTVLFDFMQSVADTLTGSLQTKHKWNLGIDIRSGLSGSEARPRLQNKRNRASWQLNSNRDRRLTCPGEGRHPVQSVE